MDLTDAVALLGAGLLIGGVACVVYAIAGLLVAGGIAASTVGVLLLVASRSTTPEAS